MHENLFGTNLLPMYQAPSKYTGEAFGAEYLYAQSGEVFKPDLDNDVEDGIDGVEDEGYDDGTLSAGLSEDSLTLAHPSDSDHDNDDDEEEKEEVSFILI